MVSINRKTTLTLVVLVLLIISLVQLSISGFLFKTDYRPEYCEGNHCMNEIIFSELPTYPKDFSERVTLDTPEEFYKQPEFYPNWEEQGLPYYRNPPSHYLGFYGFGAYPSEDFVVLRDENEITQVTFFHTSWYVMNHQGMGLYLRNESLKNYFDILIEPNIIVLGPTFPQFHYNWTQKIKITIVPKNPPKGEYILEIDAKKAPEEYSKIWSEKYGIRYSDVGMFSIGMPFYQLLVNVV